MPDLGFKKIVFIESASHYTAVMGGIFISLLLMKSKQNSSFILKTLSFSIILIGLGFALRMFWGISKNQATPSWTFICLGISGLTFLLIYIIADMKKITAWAKPFSPAGRSTLTSYLIPYFYYPIFVFLGISLPEFLLTGTIGIVKSLVFAALIIGITKVLELLKVRLKI